MGNRFGYGKIYRNLYCTECNHVSSYTFWDLLISCEYLLDDDHFTQDLKSIPNHCRWSLKPPSMLDASTRICLRPDIVSCNMTGRWETFNKTVNKLCNIYDLPYIEELELPFTNVYKNVFCFICNSAEYDNVGSVCRHLTEDSIHVREDRKRFIGIIEPAHKIMVLIT